MKNIFLSCFKPIKLAPWIRENKYSYDSSYCELLQMEVINQ